MLLIRIFGKSESDMDLSKSSQRHSLRKPMNNGENLKNHNEIEMKPLLIQQAI